MWTQSQRIRKIEQTPVTSDFPNGPIAFLSLFPPLASLAPNVHVGSACFSFLSFFRDYHLPREKKNPKETRDDVVNMVRWYTYK